MKLSSLIPVILLIVVLLVGSSCSCGGDGGTPTPTPSPTGTPTPTPSPTANATVTPTVTPTPILEYLEYIDEENGFAILYPNGWEMAAAEVALVGFAAGVADIECAPQFTVTMEELSQPMSVDAWFEELKGNYTAAGGYIPISEEALTVDGVAAIKHVCSIDVYEVAFHAMLLYVVEDSNGWIVFCPCRSDCWSKYETTFDTIVDSYRLLD